MFAQRMWGNGEFQSTHPRGVRLDSAKEEVTVQSISIHAPTWGATGAFSSRLRYSPYFNPRTHVGCDYVLQPAYHHNQDFNPRTHVGCDARIAVILQGRQISIHAPTWGATQRIFQVPYSSSISIHAPTWGATDSTAFLVNDFRFQSTHPRGVRRRYRDTCGGVFDFNPRTHVGCDLRHSQHLPQGTYFNPRTHVGCDPERLLRSITAANFNPRTHVGCDL